MSVQETEKWTNLTSRRNLTLFSPSTSTGLSIPYPSITLHAIQTLTPPSTTTPVKGLYTNLDLGSPEEDDEFPTPIELTLILPPSPTSTEPTASADPSAPAASQAEPIQALFEAISACSNLHPDAYDSEDNEDGEGQDRIIFEGNVGYEGISGLPGAFSGVSDGGLPPPFPGSGGWITAENVSEYFDEEGNWLGGEEEVEELGEGAGRVRGRDEVDAEAEGADALNGVNGDGYREDGEGGKRARME
jgi:nucleotide-sensitive chloride channel 1A